MATILIIEDTVYFSYQLAEIFKLEGFRTLQAPDYSSGLLLGERYLPDVIVSSLLPPVADGLAFLNHLHAIPRLAHIPIIALSVLDDHKYRDEVLAGGAALYLIKPFDVAELLAGVRSVLPG